MARELRRLASHNSLGLNETPSPVSTSTRTEGPRRSRRLVAMAAVTGQHRNTFKFDVSAAYVRNSKPKDPPSHVAPLNPPATLPSSIHLADTMLTMVDASPSRIQSKARKVNHKDPDTLTVDQAIASPNRDRWTAARLL